MLQLLAILATLVSLTSCSFWDSKTGQDIISGEESVVETAVKDVLAPKNSVAPVTSSKK